MRSSRTSTAVLAVAALGWLVAAAPAGAQTLIDDFETAQGPLTLTVPPDALGDTASSTVVVGAGTILGGERDLFLTFTGGGGGGESVSAAAATGVLTFTADTGASGELLAAWDGADADPANVDPTGLGGVDLTAANAGAIQLLVTAASAGTQVEVEIYTDADNRSRASRVLPAIVLPTSVFVDFSELTQSPGATGPADLTNVGAVTVRMLAEDGSIAVDLIQTAPPQIAAAQADFTAAGTPIGGGSVAPGDTMRYRVTITNPGGGGESVNLADVLDPNVTVVGAVRTTPIARNDQYSGLGNVTLVVDGVAQPNLIANDNDPDSDPLTVVAALGQATVQGGSVDVAADGTFSYTPPAGFTGIDSFTYTLSPVAGDPTADASGNPLGAFTGTATITLDSTVWFVDNTHGGPFEGTQANPFAVFKDAEAASGENEVIRIREGDGTDTGHDQGFILKAGQRLVGGAADLVIGGTLIEAGTGYSVHSHAAGNVLDLAGDHTIEGMRLNNSIGHGIAGSDATNVVVDDVRIYSAGDGDGVSLFSHSGGFTFSNGMITSTLVGTGVAVNINSGSGTFDFSGSSISRDGGGLIHVKDTSGGATVDFSGSTPTLTNGTLTGILLDDNTGGATITLTGVGDITTGNGNGIEIANTGTVVMDTVGAVSATGGAALEIFDPLVSLGGPEITFASLSSTAGSLGVRLDGVAPAVRVLGTTTINGGTGIRLESSGPVTFDGQVDVTATAGAGIIANSNGLLSIPTGTSIVSATGGPGLDVTSTPLAITLASLSAAPGAGGRGVSLVGASGTLIATGGTITGGTAGTAFHVDGGSPTVSHGGTVTQNNAQRVINVEDTTGGAVDFTAKVTGGAASTGVRINNADGNASFADLDLGTSGSPMTATGVTLSGGSAGTFGFADTQVFTTGASGFDANNGGTVEVTGTGNRVTTTTGIAVQMMGGTTLGPNGATFERVDASGSTHGIRLLSAGTGGFTVTGTGTTDGTGGVLQNITTRGLEVSSTDNITVENMDLTDAATTNGVDPTNANGTCGGLTLGQNLGCNAPIHLASVSGAVFDNVNVLRSAQVGINGHTVTGFALRNSTVTDAGNEANEFSLKFRDMLGTSEITNSTVRRTVSSGTEVDQVRIQNVASTPLDLTVTNSHFDTNAVDGPTSAFENTGFIAVGHGSADMRVELVGSFFENNKGAGLTVGVNDTTSNATVDLVITGGTFRNNNVGLEAIGHGVTATVTFDVNGATVDDNPAVGINVDLNSSSSAGATIQGHVRNNTVTHTGAGDCVQVNTRGAGSAIVAITGNTLNESGFERAIDVSTQEGSGDLDVIITGNTLNMTGINPVRAMNVNSGADTGDSGTMCAKVGGSTALEKNTVNSISGGDTRVRVRRRENTVVNLEGVPGPHPQTNQATIEAYITSQNTGATGNATVGAGFGDATCTVAPLP